MSAPSTAGKPVLAWLDLETGSLDPRRGQILEVGVLMTDTNLEWATTAVEREQDVSGHARRLHGHRFHALVRPEFNGSPGYPRIDAFCQEMHTKNGLLRECEDKGRRIDEVDEMLLNFLQAYAPAKQVHLAGSSVHFDYGYMAVHMPKSYAHLHHRLVDVSGIQVAKNLALGRDLKIGFPVDKDRAHRVFSDLGASLAMARSQWAFFNAAATVTGEDAVELLDK